MQESRQANSQSVCIQALGSTDASKANKQTYSIRFISELKNVICFFFKTVNIATTVATRSNTITNYLLQFTPLFESPQWYGRGTWTSNTFPCIINSCQIPLSKAFSPKLLYWCCIYTSRLRLWLYWPNPRCEGVNVDNSPLQLLL